MKAISKNVFVISLGAVNVFIAKDENGLTLFDTGYQGSENNIKKALNKAGFQLNDIKQIILTHAHPDHAGSLAAINALINVPTYAHPLDATAIKTGEAKGLDAVVVSPGLVNKLIYRFFIKNNPPTYPAAAISNEVNDGDELPFCKGMQIIHTPGHSPGHIAILIPSENTMIGGDICSNLPGLGYSSVNDDLEMAHKSILKTGQFDFEVLGLGHGKPLLSKASSKLNIKFSK